MTFAADNGYTPATFDELMDVFRLAINAQFSTTFTAENFVGSNWYKFLYGPTQRILENETKASEIFAKLQGYITLTNERIQRPSVSLPGLIESFEAEDYIVSVKQPSGADAGKVFICVDVDDADPDYAQTKIEICELIKDYVAAGMITQGTETESRNLTNGQSFDFSYALPNRIPVLLKLTVVASANTNLEVPTDEVIRALVFANISARYRLGWDFAPDRYFNTTDDAPWAESVLLEWSSNAGANYFSTVYSADYDDIYTFDISDIQVVIS